MGSETIRLVVSLLASDEAARIAVIEELARHYGPLVSLSRPLDFVHGGYYDAEMGSGLNRRIAAFQELVPPEALEDVKRRSMTLEEQTSVAGHRTVNIDPGLLSAGSLILASHKPAEHRLPLGPGLYSEITLYFHAGRFQPQVWTYRDYASAEMIQILSLLRARYLWQIKRQSDIGKEPDYD